MQAYIACLAYVVLLTSVFAWQPHSLRYQFLLQFILGSLITVYCISMWRKREHSKFVVQVSYEGEWNYLDARQDANWWIGEQSKMLGSLIWVQRIPLLQRHQPQKASIRWSWIFKDSVSEKDYRRLCRCIIASQQRARTC